MSTLAIIKSNLYVISEDVKKFVMGFYQDPMTTFTSLTTKQQIMLISSTTCSLMISFIIVKKKYTRYNMKKLGYRELDATSKIYQTSIDYNYPISLFGFELADSQRMTLKDAQFFAQNLVKYYINFRSEVVNKNGIYYYKETINADTFNVKDFVHYIEMKSSTGENKNNIDIDEFVIQETVNYVNANDIINKKWKEYNRPVWDIYYLHFKKYNKCILFFCCSHVIADGTMIALCTSLLQFRLWGNEKIDFNNIKEKMLQMYPKSMTRQIKAKPWWYNMYLTVNRIPMLIRLFADQTSISPDPICSINGGKHTYNSKYKWALSPPIKLAQFKLIATKQGGTVNDFFLLLCSESISKYRETKNDTVQIDDINGIGMVSLRDMANINNEFMEYCVYGTNANSMLGVNYSHPIKQSGINIATIQNKFAKVKNRIYGLFLSEFITILAAIMPDFALVEATMVNTIGVSNVIGPKKGLPLPSKNNETNDDIDYVKWLYGMGFGGGMKVFFTVLSYNGYIRTGIVSEVGSISDTDMLISNFMNAYQTYLK